MGEFRGDWSTHQKVFFLPPWRLDGLTDMIIIPVVWTTLLTNTKYLTGLLTLEYSLRKVGSKYPLLVLYTSTLEPEGREALRRRGIPHQEVAYLKPTKEKDYSNDVRFYDCWSELCRIPRLYPTFDLADIVLRTFHDIVNWC